MVYANRSRFPVFSFLDTARWAAAGTNDYVPFEVSTLNYARDSRPLMRSVRGAIPLRIRLLYLFVVCRFAWHGDHHRRKKPLDGYFHAG